MKINRIMVFVCVVLIVLLSFSGCGAKTQEQEDGKLEVVATIFPLYDFARAVGGEDIHLTMLMKPGMEVHNFDPSPADIIAIEQADVFLYIGGESDAWADSILESMDLTGKTVLRLIETIEPLEEGLVDGIQDSHGHDHAEDEVCELDQQPMHDVEYDEHIWTSPKNAMQMISSIADALSQADFLNALDYRQNADGYNNQIQQLDEQIAQLVNASPNKMLAFGDRFPFLYFANEFSLDYRSAFGSCASEGEASAGTVAALIDLVREENLPAIYYIELSSANIARTVSEETGVPMLLLHSCHNVTSDDFKAGVTYLSLMQQNLMNLEKGLK